MTDRITELSRNIVILGASSDIGAELVSAAASQTGTRVLAVSRSASSASVGTSADVEWLSGIDLTDESKLQVLADHVRHRFDRPFSVIHSVGNFWLHKPLVATPFREIAEMVASQFVSLMGAARFLTPLMQERRGGRLIAFSCNSVSYNYPDMSPFTASKAAVEAFIKCYANEHSEFGISACALALPTIRTKRVVVAKPTGDHENYVTPRELATFILESLLRQPHEVNGNVVRLFKHSHSFYHDSYYARNPRQGEPGAETTQDMPKFLRE